MVMMGEVSEGAREVPELPTTMLPTLGHKAVPDTQSPITHS